MRTPEEKAAIEQMWKRRLQPDSTLGDILDAIREVNDAYPDGDVQAALAAADTGSLTELLQVIRAVNATLPEPAVVEALADAREALVSSGLAERALHVGDAAPDFTLPDQDGNAVTLSEVLTLGPVVLSFYRGSWCPFCNFELRALQQHLDEIQDEGAALIAVSPEPPDKTMLTAEQNRLRFRVLSDVGNAVAATYKLVMEIPDAIREHQIRDIGFDVAEHNGASTYEVPVPATYVIDADGTISLAYVNADYRYRLDPLDVLQHLRSARARQQTSLA